MLPEIVAHQRQRLAAQKRVRPLESLRAQAAQRPAALDFAAALRRPGVQLIAELKRASPSKGLLCPHFDPLALAATYAAHGAAALSVLTEPHFFQGDLAYLAAVRQALPSVLLLRKDFVLDPYQVVEARAHGADAVLLIAAILSPAEMGELLKRTQSLGMTALVEVHSAEEMAQILPLEPRVVGINNRNLGDLTVDLDTFVQLRPLVPAGTVVVAESGIHTAADVRRMGQAGADAVLVGEALVTAPDVGGQVAALVEGGRL